ncbi:MAG: hypothetical protein ACKVXR_09370 [Planctomycetota bacterium]
MIHLTLLFLAAQATPSPDERQILWQRRLEDVVAIAEAEQRPILVAVNMDGESASERIVKEQYRDPEFVAMSRGFVCVIASAFRHAPRDHDDLGRRIPCPRLGEVTCGEHIELEPILFEKYLGGERIAPRHALILPDGTKPFDLFLLFDLQDLDRKLADALDFAPPTTSASTAPADPAAARDHRGRLAFETSLLDASLEEREAAVGAMEASGDAGSVEALRILLASRPPPPKALLLRIGEVARARGIEPAVAGMVREGLTGLGRWPGASGLGEDQELLLLLGRLDGSSTATRSLLLAHAVLGAQSERALATEALDGGPLRPAAPVGEWLAKVRKSPPPAASGAAAPAEVLPESDALETELARLDEALGRSPDDPEILGQYGKTTLSLARRRMESGGSGAQLLLQDADRFLERASLAKPRDVSLLLARARANYLLVRFEDQEKIARKAVEIARGDDRYEALRWVGDASARLLAARSGGDPAVEAAGILRGARALQEVAAGPEAGEKDWISLGSFLGALGLRREELAVYQAGSERFPESAALRGAMNSALWAGGRIDLASAKAEWIAARNPSSADCAWHAGYAHVLEAEERRRGDDPDRAIESYAKANRWFLKCAELHPEYKDSTDHHRALCALGRGFAHLLAGRRVEAAACLAEGIAIRPASGAARDGLDREPVDLLDGALEWRAEGASPVDVQSLLAALERADPGSAFWPRGISDSELREALRAEGRGEQEETERYLRLSIEAARRALAIADDPETRRALAQPLTIQAERGLEQGKLDEARAALADSALLLEETAPDASMDAAGLSDLAGRLREKLGAARPRFRPGR